MKKRKKKYKQKNIHKNIMFFSVTLTLMLVIGILGILVGKYVFHLGEGAESDPFAMSFFREVIPPERQAEAAGELDGGVLDGGTEGRDGIDGKNPEAAGEVRLCFAGDILFDDQYAVTASALQRGGGVHQAFSVELLGRMQEADMMMVNNEFPYTSRGTATEGKQYTFRADPEMAVWLTDMGVDIVSLANNHAYDFGAIGLLDTLDTLNEAGIPYVGAGRNLEEACAPVYFEMSDIRIAFIAATQIERLDNPDTKEATENSPGVFRCWNPKRLYEVVAEAKKNSDFVIVYIHWGTENVSEPDWAQLEQGPQIAQAGADLIIGAHPHCLQGITYFGQTPAIYSLGNFWFNSRTVDTGMLEVLLDKEGIKSVQFIPVLQSDCRAVLLSGAEKERVLSLMRDLSPQVLIDRDGFISNQ